MARTAIYPQVRGAIAPIARTQTQHERERLEVLQTHSLKISKKLTQLHYQKKEVDIEIPERLAPPRALLTATQE
jgi:hypothetical protein